MSEKLGRVLITGANGHLGRRLIERLAADGVPARAVVRSERAAATLRDLPEKPETVVLDYGDVEQLTQAARGCESAVHLVGIIKESATSSYVVAHEETSRALALAAARVGLNRLVYLSILGAHADSPNACLRSKGLAERILFETGPPTVVLRVPMVLGPGDVASRALCGQARSRVLPLLGGGRSLEQPIDADDVVSAVMAALSHPQLEHLALDLAGPESLSHRALVRRAAALYGGEPAVLPVPRGLVMAGVSLLEKLFRDPPVTRAMLEVLDRDDELDPADACRRLGIRLTPLDETLRRCVGPEAPA